MRQQVERIGRIAGLASGLAGLAFAARWVFLQCRRVTLKPTDYTTPPLGADAISPNQRRIIVSDLHLGGGDRLDDFEADQELIAFLDQYVTRSEPTELILAGDTIEFLQVRIPGLDDEEWSDQAAAQRMRAVIQAHAGVFAALARFIALPQHQITVLIGNHDFELHYPAAKAAFTQALGLAYPDPRLRFGLSYHGGGIYMVHGNQFDAWNRFVHFAGICEPFEVVRGTQIVKEVINDLEEDSLPIAPLLDNVKPTSAFFWYLLALPRLRNTAARRFFLRGVTGFLQVVAWPTPHEMPITGRGPGGLLSAPIFLGLWGWIAGLRRQRVARQQRFSRQVSAVAGGVPPPDQVLDQMQSEAVRQVRREMRAFSDRYAREMLKIARQPQHRADRLFICGHTHLAQVVPLGQEQTYINTGTWTEVIYDVEAMLRQEQRFPFLEVRYPDGVTPEAHLLVWCGPDQPPQAWR
ncbi:metallophosphoesterase [Candidatus Oscillochloris fontis]|uniref:metallophosphoesterase n=1 Tax=Candidatus Oscillochloris fontis TaxID=2496868 RepID=UPI00101C030E|nr:metallophosphoesterase [Candidatus Oscillochloris fontis]